MCFGVLYEICTKQVTTCLLADACANSCVQDIIEVQIKTQFAIQLNIKASQSVLVQDLQNTLEEQFVDLGHAEWADGKLLCDGEILRWDRTMRSYAQEFGEPFGPIDWVQSQYGD